MDPDTERLAHALSYPIVAFLATLRAQTAPTHRVIAGLFWMWTFANTTCLLLNGPLDAHGPPYRGLILVALYAQNSAYSAIIFGTVGAIAVYYARVRARWAIVAWVATTAAFIVWKELTHRPSIEFHEPVVLSTTVAALILVVRSVLAPADRLVRPDEVHAILALLLCADLVRVTVVSIAGLVEHWPAARGLDTAVYGLVTVGYLVFLARDWRTRSRLGRT